MGHIKKLQKGLRDIQNGKMPRRLLHATCGVTSVSGATQTPNSGLLANSGISSSLSVISSGSRISKAGIFDDFDSISLENAMPISKDEDISFG